MSADANFSAEDEIDRLKSHLQVYEGLIQSQAVEIASLKAEVAYLKKQLKTKDTLVSRLQAAHNPELTHGPARSTPPTSDAMRSVAGMTDSEHSPIVDLDVADAKTARTQSGTKREAIESPKKRVISPDPDDAFPEHSPNHHRDWFQQERPRKKPRLVPEVVIPRLTPHQLKVYGPLPRPPTRTPEETEKQRFPSTTTDDDSISELSSLSSIPSAYSRFNTPAGDQSRGPIPTGRPWSHPPEPDFIGRRSPSRELTYLDHDPPVGPIAASTSVNQGPSTQPSQTSRHDDRDVMSTPLPIPRTRTNNVVPRDGRMKPSANQGGQQSSVKIGISSQMRPTSPRLNDPSSSGRRVDRLAGIVPFTVTIDDPALLDVVVNRKQVANIYGGSVRPVCVQASGRNFLFPKVNLCPVLPRNPGSPGLMYRANPEPQWKGDVQTLFVGERDAAFRYCGEYRLAMSTPLSKEEYAAALSNAVSADARGTVVPRL